MCSPSHAWVGTTALCTESHTSILPVNVKISLIIITRSQKSSKWRKQSEIVGRSSSPSTGEGKIFQKNKKIKGKREKKKEKKWRGWRPILDLCSWRWSPYFWWPPLSTAALSSAQIPPPPSSSNLRSSISPPLQTPHPLHPKVWLTITSKFLLHSDFLSKISDF